ncbi:hypothetical protein PENANT_c001G09524 [Penicillium antarcticum]|uniref:Major facilitator superfamily (MFS) profile domain-containing protein n=1 Tax=Penicillium antarcticum TaxID=416450 RepID=A0A1V6QML2_9EURO|nr:hypothetical protein PENANT_c001G09524 [Penicillium antarcticum]
MSIIYDQVVGHEHADWLLLGLFTSYLERKVCLHIAVILACVAIIVVMTTDYKAGHAGRLVIGLGNELLMTLSQLYTQVCLLVIPESPRWLLQQNKKEQAYKDLIWLRPDRTTVNGEMEDI